MHTYLCLYTNNKYHIHQDRRLIKKYVKLISMVCPFKWDTILRFCRILEIFAH